MNSRRRLTNEQRDLWEEWLPYAYKVAWNWLRRNPGMQDDVKADVLEAAALSGYRALCSWKPERGHITTCIHWAVSSSIYRVLQLDRSRKRFVTLENFLPNGRNGEGSMLADILPDDSLPDAGDVSDAARLYAEVEDALTWRLAKQRRPDARAAARLFIRCRFGGERLSDIARELGVTRQTLDMRLTRMQPVFDEWAAEIRKEAA